MENDTSTWQRSVRRITAVLATAAVAILFSFCTATLSANDAQTWRDQNEDFNWQQSDGGQVRILGRGAEDKDGNLYFVGSKTYRNANGDFIDDENMFVARINADDSLGWTKEYGTNETDGANFVTIMNETTAGSVVQYLYVVGWTWGFMDDGAHALNGFGRFGGRDAVLLKLRLSDGRKHWARQFGSTVDDKAYGVQRDGGFDTLLLTGTSTTEQVDAVVEMDVDIMDEPRQRPFSLYETQLMDARARQGAYPLTQYQFAASLKRNGDIVDFAMDGGVTISPRRQRIAENSSLVGEYAVVLNKQPLDDVQIIATIECLSDPADEATVVQQLAFVGLPQETTQRTLTFTRKNWNREQLVRVTAVNDAIAEGVHYAVISHETLSRDPLFNGTGTPFLYGRNMSIQIDDDDLPGVQLSRRHVFVAEGDLDDTYEVVLRSRPWHAVTVTVVSVDSSQAIATPSTLVFEPSTWNVSQVITVSAVDDDISENEYGGLHFGGRLVHYSGSKDRRYRTGRPACFDIPRCDPQDLSDCLSDSTDSDSIRVCDLTLPHCGARLGNGACIANIGSAHALPPVRFGADPLLPADEVNENDEPPFSYAALRALLADQARDTIRLSAATNMSAEYPFRLPPPSLRGFVLSFLGLLNLGQAQQLHQNFRRSLQTICSGLDRLATHHWVTQSWPEGAFPRVLNATLAMFGGSVTKRHLWQCGMASFRPGSNGINVSIWDNDPGVTLSTRHMEVAESSDPTTSTAKYSIVLNAPPSIDSPRLEMSFCADRDSDSCGLWGDFETLVASIYAPTDQQPPPNVSIAVIGNSQLTTSPSIVTFTSTNWYIPQWISVRATNDDLAEDGIAALTISHKVQTSPFGYRDELTAFWFRGESPSMNTLFPRWSNDSEAADVPYNFIPRVIHSPQHKLINVQVQDDDTAGVVIQEMQPQSQAKTRESDDFDDVWVGDSVKSLAFSDMSITKKAASATSSVGGGTTLQSVLVFETNAVTFLKFHLPHRHEGDTQPDFAFATIRVYETPFKVINASSDTDDSSSSTAFETIYSLSITVVDNAWTRVTVSNGSVDPATVRFLQSRHTIIVTALLTKQRFLSIDVSPLVKLLLPTKLPVVSLKIQVLGSTSPGDTGGESTSRTTQLCSSLFERALRPSLVVGFAFPNRLLQLAATQSSTVSAASLAVDGARAAASATTVETEPWWEATLPTLARVGSLAIFVPPEMNSGDVVDSPVVLVVVASLVPLDGQAMPLAEAQTAGCPDACPLVQRLPLRKTLTISELNAGVRSLRIYREGSGVLALTQVEAYDPHIVLAPTANGAGLKSRLKMDWNGRLRSHSWRLLQSIRQSEDENVARGMRTQQSSTDPEQAVSSLAVDGQRASAWDPLVRVEPALDAPIVAGSTRTAVEDDPWWEVDLGGSVPIARVDVFPYLGESGRSFCGKTPSSSGTAPPSWAGDLFSYSTTDPLLQLQDPFAQTFQVLLSDDSLSNGATAMASTALQFSCAGGVTSVAWTEIFAKARFVTVKRPGAGVVLMLNEVVVTRWNAATTPQLLLVDLRGTGDAPLALSSIQLFAPTDDAVDGSFALPIAYSIHSVSSQRAPTGDGSAAALLSVSTSDCYIAGAASFREWIVLKLAKPTPVGLVDIQVSIDKCGTGVGPVTAVSIAARGASLEGIRTTQADASLASVVPTGCSLTALATLVDASTSSGCAVFSCEDASCRATRTTTDAVVFSDFNDLAFFGVPSLVPTTRLPLSQQETRAMLLRDNPVMLWSFDTEPRATVSATRASGVLSLTSTTAVGVLSVDEALEQSFFSNAVAVQPAMSAFSIELWIQLGSTLPAAATLVTLAATSAKVIVADVKWTAQAQRGVFTVYDPDSGASCSTKLPLSSAAFDTVGRWYHVIASYDPSNARIQLSVRFETSSLSHAMTKTSSNATCSLPLLSVHDKSLYVGAFSSSAATGIVGQVASVAWYVSVPTDRQWLDHFHDFMQRGTRGPLHNSYALRLASRPVTPVTVTFNAETACYYFSLCNITVLPRALVFSPEHWNVWQNVRVLATDDQLYEGLQHALVVHEATSPPTYDVESVATTQDLANQDTDKWRQYKNAVSLYNRAAIFTLENQAVVDDVLAVLSEIHANWSTQIVDAELVARHPYKETLAIDSVTIEIEDATVPGIEFSTSSLIVSEQGKGNDYQILLLSEPTSDVYVVLDAQSDCYRECFETPVCPSQSGDGDLACGGGSAGSKLCNITVSPDVLVFTPANWSFPQTVRVLAVDDLLDEADVHLSTIKATSRSLDPVYDALFLPEIVVAVEDNDATAVAYSTLQVAMQEKKANGTQYLLALLTEPWANVTVAMSNEADGTCYRPCGYPFDVKSCGLPRQQSVSSVRLATDSPREIHEISLKLPRPRVMEVQRLVTVADHVDHVYAIQVTGGFAPDVQVIEFAFSAAFKTRFKSAAAITTAGTYIKSFKIGIIGKTATSSSIDGFATAAQVETAINGLLLGRTSRDTAVQVTRELQYDQSLLRWQVTFLRFVADDLTFPRFSVAMDLPFEGTLATKRTATVAAPSGSLIVQYGNSDVTSKASFPLVATESDVEAVVRDIDTVYTALATRRIVTTSPPALGLVFTITFTSVGTYETLRVSKDALVAASNAVVKDLTLTVAEVQAPNQIGGFFAVAYASPYVNRSANATVRPKQTNAIAWNASADAVAMELARLHGVGTVSVSRQQLAPEGSMGWTVAFVTNNGDLPLLQARSVNLTGKGVGVEAVPVVDGVSLGGRFMVEMGGLVTRTNPLTQRVYSVQTAKLNSTSLPFNVSVHALAKALASLNVTERANVTRVGRDCDAFSVCEGYVWTISYVNSAGNLPPIQVYGTNTTLTGSGAVVSARTVANGTYLGGYFSLQLELLDAETNVTHSATTWDLPVNVSAPGMDQALEAIRFVRSNREAEYDPETHLGRGMQFDKGVRVYREGPYLDGGYTWRLAWAIEDYVRFQDVRIAINASLVTQQIEPLTVPSELDLSGTPRCNAIPRARFQRDATDPFGLRGFCVYDIVNVTMQERFLCNYTVENPWIVFTPSDWCNAQHVLLTPVDDFIDEATVPNGNTTFSNLTHTVFSDDLIYSALPLERIRVAVENDDVARVLVSESHLDVSEDGAVVAYYELVLTTEPLYDVKIIALPWLDGADTKCYRFGLCNVTFAVDTYVFTPRNWNVPQRVVVRATDDDLDEYDTHGTGISHVSYSDDLKYHQLSNIPKIHVTVTDNDDSAFFVSKASVNVTEGGANDSYGVVLGSEPFAKVTVSVQNIGTKGNYATAAPATLTFTWLNWNVPQVVRVAAVDDDTQDVAGSSSVMVHSIGTNDLIYAALKNLGSVKVWIQDNDVSGIALSTLSMAVAERAQPYSYSLRLTSEPWFPVTVAPNGSHGCFVRAATQVRVCNVSMVTTALYFGAGNWSQWQPVTFLAFDDALEETPIHKARITHASTSKDPLYVATNYPSKRVALNITDNDVSFVTISLALTANSTRSRLHVAEGGFNDSYSVVLNTEPYENVIFSVRPRVERIVSIDAAFPPLDAPQVGAAFGKSLSSVPTGGFSIVFTPQDWSTVRVITVFGIDDEVPEDPTQFSAIAHAVQSADAKYNVSNVSRGIADVAVIISDREAIPPPLPVSSLFDATGTRILVTFDSTVYHAATMVIRASATGSAYGPKFASFACSLVFASSLVSLGTGAGCAWWSDLKQLVVTLGVGASIVPTDVLLFYDCTTFVNQVCQSSSVLRARHTSRAYTQATATIQVDPAIVVKPKIVLSAPNQVGTCGAWQIDASMSMGSAGRAFKEVAWFALPRAAISMDVVATAQTWFDTSKTLYAALVPLCAKYDKQTALDKTDLPVSLAPFVATLVQLKSFCYVYTLMTAASAATAFQAQANSTLLQPGTTYVVGLSLVNAFSQQAVAIQSVYVGKLPSPVVSTVGESSLQVSRGESTLPIVLQADATLSCPTLAGAAISFRWFATVADTDGGGAPVAVNLNATNTAKDPRVFRIPRAQLQVGKTYRVRVEASVPLAATSSAFFTIAVVSSPLIAVVSGGDRGVGEKDTVVLNGSLAVDPDNAVEPFTYVWRCEDWTNETLAAIAPVPCVNASSASLAPLALPSSPPSLSPTLTIEPFSLQPLKTLRFFMAVAKAAGTTSKTARSAIAQTTVWTTTGSVPEVSIQASAKKLNPTSRLTLTATVKSTYPYTARWLEDEGDLGLPDTASNITAFDAFTMPLTNPSTAIRRNRLTAGQRYVLRYSALDINGNRGFALVSFKVNAPPSPGRFQVTPREGFAIQDAFSLVCSQWTDDVEDLPLQYSFGVLPSSVFETLGMNVSLIRQRMQTLVASQLLPMASVTMLPPEGQADSVDVTVVAFVSDAMGGMAMAFDSVVVRMPEAATTQPVAFASRLLSGSSSAVNTSDAATKAKYLFSAALVMRRAMAAGYNATECPGTGTSAGVCSGQGTCDVASLTCVCDATFMGPSCQYKFVDVRAVNDAILSSLASSAVQAVEPSSSGLSQLASVVDTVLQSSTAAFNADGLGQVTSLSSGIAQNALALQDATDFLESTGATLLRSLSTVLAVRSAAVETTAPAQVRRRRRLASGSAASAAADATTTSTTTCASESDQAKTTFQQAVATLQPLAAIASQDLLPGEPPALLTAGQISVISGAGSRLQSPSSSLSVNLTSAAIACLGSGAGSASLFINVFQMAVAPHSICSLQNGSVISSSTVVTVHDRAALSLALVGKTNGVVAPLTLSSSSACVTQAAAAAAASGKAARRLSTTVDGSAWQPLVVLAIPHSRELTAVEQRNFSTTCRAWNVGHGGWEAGVCFKDNTQSTAHVTVCYCSELRAAPGLEVVVALQERLDFSALSSELYRDDAPSIVGPISVAVLVALFVVVGKVGQRLDRADDKRDKEKTIKGLNRAKWSELQQRAESDSAAGLEDFATYMATREKLSAQRQQEDKPMAEASALPAATSESQLTTTAAHVVAAASFDASVAIPNETRVLFGSSDRLQRHYATLTRLLRGCNTLLVVVGVVAAFVGVDFYFVLGNSTGSELVLFLYGKPLGIVLLVVSGVLLALGLLGVELCRGDESSARLARSSYAALLLATLLAQLFLVFLAFRYVNDLAELPVVAVDALRRVWTALSASVQDELQTAYGCCGFTSVADAASGCPEEAFDAAPPRTCFSVVQARALTLFETSFVFLEAVFLVQVAALLLILTIRRWRQLRLQQLASAAGEPMLASLVDISLLCTMPSVLQLLLLLMAVVLLSGVDLLAQLHVLSNALLAGLLGVEIGVVEIVAAAVYALVLMQGLAALHFRDARRLQSFSVLVTACVVATVALFVFVDRLHSHWLLDPAVVDWVHAKYLQLSRQTLVDVETSLACCGFDAHDEGACVVASDAVPTCRDTVLRVLDRELAVLSRRVRGFVAMQAVVLFLAALANVRLRRFAVKPAIQPLDAAPTPGSPVVATSFLHALVHQSSVVAVLVGSAAACVLGLVAIGAGLDALYQLNVLHLSQLLRVFDRHVAVYLLSAGAAIVVFGSLGVGVACLAAHRVHRRLAAAFVAASAAIFVAAFGFSGFAYRFATVPLNDEALDERLEALWVATPPKTTRVFLQNALTCCGYDKIERADGSVVFTDAGEWAAWRLESDTVAADAYSPAPSRRQRRRLSATMASPRRLTQLVCPVDATQPCAPQLKRYVRRVASRAFQLSVALLASVAVIVVAVGGLLWQPSSASASASASARSSVSAASPPSWACSVARTLLVLLCVASLFVALAAFFLGLDVATHWSLFSSSVLQLVFPRSIGAAFFLYAAALAGVNAYAAQGVVQEVVHRVFLQSLARGVLVLGGWLCVALTAYASHFGGAAALWQPRVHAFLDRQWDSLSPFTQHRLSLEFQCCGYNDPTVVVGRGLVFDRAAAGFECSLAAARGCRHVMEAQMSDSFAWLFVFSLTLTLLEMLALACSLVVLQRLRRVHAHDWFVIESRLRFAAGTYRSELRRSHVLLSVATQFDRKYTRAQRLATALCGLLTSLAAYAAWFAHRGCHRRALRTCRQPDAWAFLGMGLVYGGLLGFAAQLAARALFEAVRHRSDDETQEVAVTRQRKEKALLFRGLFSRKAPPPLSDRAAVSAVASKAAASLVDAPPSHATTEERWYTWLARSTHSLFCTVGVLLFLAGCALATYMALVLLGFQNALYGVTFDHGPKETLVFGVLAAATALFAWLAIDRKQQQQQQQQQQRQGGSAAVFVVVAVAAVLLLAGLCLGVFMASQTLDEDAANWTIRNTNFSVPLRLRDAWARDATGFFRHRVQQELRCCGFVDARDAAFRPCPQGTTVQVQYEAVRVDGSVVAATKDEARDLGGCYAPMLAQFHVLLDRVAYAAAAAGVALVLLAASALFLANDVAISKDATLRLRVASRSSSDVRETFERVVGLKIAAPARGKIFSKLLSTSLESVAPHVASELAAESLAPAKASPPSPPTVRLPNGQLVSSSLVVSRRTTVPTAAGAVPFPAWIVRVVFAVCSAWALAMGSVVVVNSLELGVATAWRCVAAWGVGVVFHVALVEPLVVFLRIVGATLRQWWEATMLCRLLRFGRDALRIRPSAEAEAARFYASLSLYERIRFNAAVRLQRRLATRLARRRFLAAVRENRANSHRALVAHRRSTLKEAIAGFTAEEIDAFRLLFQNADTARLGLVAHTVISQSIYQLGVRVEAPLVRGFLLELDPAYADLVDFEHFLYGMHRVRVHHQQEQAAAEAAKALTTDERAAAALAKEAFVSSSSRFGPTADPQSRVLVKRQNLMRELREKRESLSYRLMSKVSKLPPLLQRSRSAQAQGGATSEDGVAAATVATVASGVDESAMAALSGDEAPPTGTFVLLQNRKLSPKKRALEMILKKKSRDDKGKTRATTTADTSAPRSPKKIMQSLRLPGALPRARSTQKQETVSPPEVPSLVFAAIPEGDETDSPSPTRREAPVGSVVATGHAHEGSEGDGALPAEEAKPFGTFMLLAKQTASSGKSKVMEKVLQKQSLDKRAGTAGSGATADVANAEEEADSGGEDAGDASRPTTAETREKANAVATSSLERALKKKAASGVGASAARAPLSPSKATR